MDSLVVQTAIGLLFVFATFAALVSIITETGARLIGLRGEYLLRGLRSLLDGQSHFALHPGDLLRRTSLPPVTPASVAPSLPWVTKLMDHPLVSASADKATMPANAGNAKLSSRDRRNLPSYLPSRSFAAALIDLLVPDAAGQTTMVDVKAAVQALPVSRLRTSLLALTETAATDLDKFRGLLEQWYDDHMARVSGWYKRHVRWISLAIAAVLVIAFNLSVLQMGRSLYTDQVLNGAVVTTATAASVTKCQSEDPAHCLQDLRAEVQQVRGAGLPIGWSVVPACAAPAHCSWLAKHGLISPLGGIHRNVRSIIILLIGWLLMVATILPGARFWFDALARLGSLRSTGPKPATT